MGFFGGDSNSADWDQIAKLMGLTKDINRFDQQGLFTDTTWDADKNVQTTGLAPGMENAFTQFMQRQSAPPRTYESPTQFSSMLDAKMANQMQRQGILDPSFQLPQTMFGDGSATQRNNRNDDYLQSLIDAYTYQPRGGTGGTDPGTGPPGGGSPGEGEGYSPTGSQPDRYGPDGNINTRDMDRTNEIADFVDWGIENHAFQDNRSFNDILNDYIPNAPEGTDPGALEQFFAQYGDNVGRGVGGLIGLAAGVPGIGSVGKWIASKLQKDYWKDHQWASPADQGAMDDFMQGTNISADQAIDDFMSPNYSPEMNPADRGARGQYGWQTGLTDQLGNSQAGMNTDFRTQFDWAHGNDRGFRIGADGKVYDRAGRAVGADGQAPDAGDLWVTFDYGEG